ncbi:MAG: tetratricopeptide repeat protein [Alphaproteobacteria bacterium]
MFFTPAGLAQEIQSGIGDIDAYYLPRARAGDVEAQYLLGLGYERGLSGTVDRRAAAKWYRDAAAAGHVTAAYRLGLLLLRGDSIEDDPKEAADFFRQAAAENHPEALYYLGYLSERGLGVEADQAAALNFFERAAKLGLTAAMKAAASLQVRRQDQPQDLTKAWYWLNLAATAGDSEAGGMRSKLESMMTDNQLEEARALTSSMFSE